MHNKTLVQSYDYQRFNRGSHFGIVFFSAFTAIATATSKGSDNFQNLIWQLLKVSTKG